MKLLIIDTATEACSAALSVNGNITGCYEIAPRRHAELILGMVDTLLTDAGLRLQDLDFLGFGRGPGAFTGVRVATGVIQGLAFAADLPVTPVSTLAALAQGCSHRDEAIFAAIDARMGEIYWGLFQMDQNHLAIPLQPEAVTRPDSIDVPAGYHWYGVGSGWHTYHAPLSGRLGNQLSGFNGDCYPRAADMVPLAIHAYQTGNAVSADQALPVYLRDQVTGG